MVAPNYPSSNNNGEKLSTQFDNEFQDQDDMLFNVENELVIPPFTYDDDDEDEDDLTQISNIEQEDDVDGINGDEYYEDEDLDDMDDQDDDNYETDSRDRAALTYLYRYEQMVRQQDAEDKATIAHLRPLFNRLRYLGGIDNDDDSKDGNEKGRNNIISYNALQNQSAVGGGEDGNGDDEKMEKMGDFEVPNLLSYSSMKKAKYVLENAPVDQEVLTTDKQLMLVLQELTSNLEANDATLISNASEQPRKNSLSFPEFLHCYKTVINGMMVLQMFPSSSNISSPNGTTLSSTAMKLISSTSKENDTNNNNNFDEREELSQGVQYHRSRTRDRSLSLLRAFCAPKKTKELTSSSKTTSSSSSQENTDSSTNLLNEMRKIIALKDQQIVDLRSEIQRDARKEENNKIDSSTKLYLNTTNKSLEETTNIHKRRVTFAIIFGISFLIWYCGAFFVVQMMKESSNNVSPPTKEWGSTIKFPWSSPRSSDLVVENHHHEERTSFVSQEGYLDLQEAFHESLRTISHLEKMQNSHIKQITKLQSSMTKSELDHQSLLTKTETNLLSCKATLQDSIEQTNYRKLELQNSTFQLRACETQVKLLEPNLKLSEDERRIVFETHKFLTLRQKQKKQMMAIVAGALVTILAPHIFNFLGALGSSTKIVSIAGVTKMGSIIQIPFLDRFFGGMKLFWGKVRNLFKFPF